jgi:hypothetical protein
MTTLPVAAVAVTNFNPETGTAGASLGAVLDLLAAVAAG